MVKWQPFWTATVVYYIGAGMSVDLGGGMCSTEGLFQLMP